MGLSRILHLMDVTESSAERGIHCAASIARLGGGDHTSMFPGPGNFSMGSLPSGADLDLVAFVELQPQWGA